MTNKYRIYDLVEKQYVEEPDFRWMFSRSGKLYNSETDEWHDVGVRYLVEFFTGLKDKNEVEIFEGDVVKWSNSENCKPKEVRYWLDGFVAGNRQTSMNLGDLLNMCECVVIGNVHDNSKLIK